MGRGKEFIATDANNSSLKPPSIHFLGELYYKILIITVMQYQNTYVAMTAYMPTPSELRSCSWHYLH